MSTPSWSFQPGIDTSESFSAFSYYLALPPPRNMSVAARAMNVSPYTAKRWADQGLWRERAQEHDQTLNAARRAELEKAYRQDGVATALEWLEPIQIAKGLLRAELEKLQQESHDRPNTRLKVNELARLFREVFQAERLIRGQATEIKSDELDLSKLSDLELRAYDELVRKARKENT